MKVVAFMQCLWLKNAVAGRLSQDRMDAIGKRERWLRTLLFYGGKSGTVLRQTLGDEWCDRIVWDEITRQIGDHSAACFPPDYDHIKAVLAKHRPTVVVAVGSQAKTALEAFTAPSWRLLCVPHPAARGSLARAPLAALKVTLDKMDFVA